MPSPLSLTGVRGTAFRFSRAKEAPSGRWRPLARIHYSGPCGDAIRAPKGGVGGRRVRRSKGLRWISVGCTLRCTLCASNQKLNLPAQRHCSHGGPAATVCGRSCCRARCCRSLCSGPHLRACTGRCASLSSEQPAVRALLPPSPSPLQSPSSSPWTSSTPRSSRRGPSSRRGGRKEDRGRGERVRDAGVTLCDLREQRIWVHLTPRSRTSSGRSTCTTSPPYTSTTSPSCTR